MPQINKVALLTLMTIQADFVAIDPVSETLIFDDGLLLPLRLLSQSKDGNDIDDEWRFEYVFDVKSIFDTADGKYNSVFGNVAFIDCNYVFSTFIESTRSEIKEEWFIDQPVTYNEVVTALDRIDAYLKETGFTMCDFAFEVDGCLKD